MKLSAWKINFLIMIGFIIFFLFFVRFLHADNVPHATLQTTMPAENVDTTQVLWLYQNLTTTPMISQAQADSAGNLKVNVSAGAISITSSGTPIPVKGIQVIGQTYDENGDLDAVRTTATSATLVSPSAQAVAVVGIPGYKIRVLGYAWSFSTTAPVASTANGLLSGTAKGIISVIPFGLAGAAEQSAAPNFLMETASGDNLLYGQFAGTQTVIMYFAGQYIYVRDANATATLTATLTASPTPTLTFTITKTPTPTMSASISPSPTRSLTASRTPSATLTATISATLTPSPTKTWTKTVTETPTVTRTNTSGNTATITPTPSKTITLTKTFTYTKTVSPTPTFTQTRSWTRTPTPTRTFTITKTATLTITQTFTITKTPTPSATLTRSPTPTVTP